MQLIFVSSRVMFKEHTKQKEEDIAVCECKYNASVPDSACGERCLNVLTSTECLPGYCPCGDYCKNQRFQKCEYAKTKVFKTEGRGWGLLADEDIKAGQFIIEYCGEVIPSEEAKRRSQTYEAQGLMDAYIISLDANYFVDATKKGSLARFINHSCQPNCETRKWTVMGETRVGIFAKQDISFASELAYDYNFEWYGGANEHNHVWEDGDERYTVDEFPLYDSAEDEPSARLLERMTSINPESIAMTDDYSEGSNNRLASALNVEPLYSVPVEAIAVNTGKSEPCGATKSFSEDTQKAFQQTNPIISGIQSDSAAQSFNFSSASDSKKRSAQHIPKRRSKQNGRKQFDAKHVAKLFASKEAQEEVIKYEELRKEATSKLDSLYDEIRPAIEEHERDSQDSVPTSVAEKWIEATCSKWKAEFDLHFSIVKNVVCPRQSATGETNPPEAEGKEDPVKYLTI
ncbi:hypothetical protein RJ640_020134 [Escallonia rubra]|uniref:Histone-lysine N-methyltransferase ASHH1 n=1 Tax=Escallonia rubra TaxID=112253 RepID=A0AA88R4G2_9ASTE|nr:hypothetical protein RJ640_020134 [Escallonia rubra]